MLKAPFLLEAFRLVGRRWHQVPLCFRHQSHVSNQNPFFFFKIFTRTDSLFVDLYAYLNIIILKVVNKKSVAFSPWGRILFVQWGPVEVGISGVAALRAQEIPKAPGREEDGGCSLAIDPFYPDNPLIRPYFWGRGDGIGRGCAP